MTGWHLLRILVMGGTAFLGRALVEAALGHGHEVTLFNRGVTNPGLFPGLETIHGDRITEASMLSGRSFDVVIDVAGMEPKDVGPVVAAVEPSVERYAFISTVSVYADHSVPQMEGHPVLSQSEDRSPGEAYGAGKAAAEQFVLGAFGDRALVIRPGLIVGPHDPTDRFAYWPRRVARGGRVLAPGSPGHPVQFIDVRDLACWVVHAAEDQLDGIFNATGHPTTLGDLLETCQRVIASQASTLVWVKDEDLLAAGVSAWMGIPLWIAVPGWEAHAEVAIERALAAGLSFRPLDETIRDTLAWDLARGGPKQGAEGLTSEREDQLLSILAPS
jgi:2'-hydroxyisoflavone reductase